MGKITLESRDNSFLINGLEFQKGYISIKNNSRTIEVVVYDTASRNIYIGFHNNYTADVAVAGSVFIKLIKYK